MSTRHTRRTHHDAGAVDDTARGVISLALAELRAPAEQISRAAGLPAGFLRTYLDRGDPAALPGPVRRRLATHLGVPEQMLR